MLRRPPRFLFVCTANINRSPMAAAWAEHHLARLFVAAELRSAGTHAWSGAPAGADAILAMDEHALDMRSHRSSPLTTLEVEWADEVVVMEPMHAARVGDLGGADKTFCLWTLMGGSVDHVLDPQGKTLDAFKTAAGDIGSAVGRFAESFVAQRRAIAQSQGP